MAYIFFWRPHDDHGWLSNWYDAPFTTSDNTIYKTSEHYMMHHKALLFKDYDTAFRILGAETPKIAQTLGRQVKNFDEKTWKEHRLQIMYDGLVAKFEAHDDLRDKLIKTYPSDLVEASPVDKIWGIGMNPKDAYANPDPSRWKGENLLGYVLGIVRTHFMK
jgi:ribA/ribD-fused uncharacterized protein